MKKEEGVELRIVDFHDDQVRYFTVNGNNYVPIKPICNAIGLDWGSQWKMINNNYVLKSTIVVIPIVASDGKKREMFCLPLERINAWLFKIQDSRYTGETQRKLRLYQKDCADTLARASSDDPDSELNHSMENLIGFPLPENAIRPDGALNARLTQIEVRQYEMGEKQAENERATRDILERMNGILDVVEKTTTLAAGNYQLENLFGPERLKIIKTAADYRNRGFTNAETAKMMGAGHSTVTGYISDAFRLGLMNKKRRPNSSYSDPTPSSSLTTPPTLEGV